jgi:signal transduction histidine kinase
MAVKRDPSKALQIGFLALLILSAAQVTYWIAENVSYSRYVRDQLETLYRGDAEAIAAIYAGASQQTLDALLPHLQVDKADKTARVRPDALAAVEDASARRINRYLWEGGFFLVVLFGGMAVLTRTIRHDAELRRRQQNFLAAVSHEFKSPLASMRLSAETLLMRAQEADSQRLGRRILEDDERLQRMIDNLLDTTRLEEGRHKMAPVPRPLAAAVDASVAEIADRAGRHDIELTTDVDESLVLNVDPTALDSILRNLLDNAVKACIAGNGHRIQVKAACNKDVLALSVTDDGAGFAPEDAAMMFEKFYRLGDEIRRSSPGTGLGLYIVKRLVQLSGARIAARSEGPGRGATVTVSWPASALA